MDYNKLVELRQFERLTGFRSVDDYRRAKPTPKADNSWFRHRGRGGKCGPAPCSVKRNCY